MALAEWFWKHYNSDVTGVGRSPLRKRFPRYRCARLMRKQKFKGAKKIQDVEGVKPDTRYHLMGVMRK